MNKPNKEAIILFLSGILLLSFGIPMVIDGNAFGLALDVFGVSFIIMSFWWRD